MELVILEGCRGTGKSTIAFQLRQRTKGTTLINFTGFHDDNQQGLEKISDYYDAWMKLFFQLHNHNSKCIFDRFFFSERVFSELYKDYDFKTKYNQLLDYLEDLAFMNVKINIVLLTISDEEELAKRLMRDKVPFGEAEESAQESLRQQEVYHRICESLYYNRTDSPNLNLYVVDTTGKTTEEVYEEVEKLVN